MDLHVATKKPSLYEQIMPHVLKKLKAHDSTYILRLDRWPQ